MPHGRFASCPSGGSLRIETPTRVRRRLGLTPMIDVVFLLLVFFILVSSWVDFGRLELAVAPPGVGAAPFEDALLVRVWAERPLDLNGQPTTLAQLRNQLTAAVLRDAEREVIVTPESSVSLQRLVSVLDEVRLSGVRRVSLRRR